MKSQNSSSEDLAKTSKDLCIYIRLGPNPIENQQVMDQARRQLEEINEKEQKAFTKS